MATGEVFKTWVSEWGIRIGIFLVFLPALFLLVISTANINSASGFYGIDADDVQFSLILPYATFIGYFPLEKRFFNYFVTKDYLFLSLALQLFLMLCSYSTRNFTVLLITRFLEGITIANVVSTCLALIISRFQGDRAVKIVFAFSYAILLSVFPFITFITGPFLDQVNYNELYMGSALLFVPGIIWMLVIMKRGRLRPKASLEGLDWQSVFLLLLFLFTVTYALVYGQELNWFDDKRIGCALSVSFFCGVIFIVRQRYSQNPYINIRVFKNKHYLVGLALLLVLYLARGALNITTSYFADVLRMDPPHIGRITLLNILGAIAGTIVSSTMIHNNTFRYPWIIGFGCLLIFDFWMIFLFDTYGDAPTYFLPLFIQGFGTGMLLTPIVIYMVSSVPVSSSLSATTMGIFGRLMGTCISTAIINYFKLYSSENHFNRFQDNLSRLNPNLNQSLEIFQHNYAAGQILMDKAGTASLIELNHHLAVQSELRSAMDYYYLIGWMLLLVIILIAIAPLVTHTKRSIDPESDLLL